MRKLVAVIAASVALSAFPSSVSVGSGAQTARMVTLHLRRHLVATGRTESPASPASCVTDVEVHVLRRSASGWVRITTTTAVDGSFRVKLPDRRGRYVAVVDSWNGCDAARSNVARHRHG